MKVYFKDEGKRLGIQSFKGPGATYALVKEMAKQLEKNTKDFKTIAEIGEAYTAKFGETTFITATDGNHGRATAWAAKQVN
jgi:diaminopropionate ammonia-lyase